MYRVYRYKTAPNYWPAIATVYIDNPNGSVTEYVTDVNGTPSLVGGSTGEAEATTWGNIAGTLTDQVDLISVLNSKYAVSNPAGYITAADLSGYATEVWVTSQNYLTGITSGQVISALGYTPQSSAQVLNSIASSLIGYATESWTLSQNYLTSVSENDVITALGFTPLEESDIVGLILVLG